MVEKRGQVLRGVLEDLKDNPFVGDVKPIKERPGIYRRRLGSYRIIYSIDHEARVAKVFKIGTRGGIYK